MNTGIRRRRSDEHLSWKGLRLTAIEDCDFTITIHKDVNSGIYKYIEYSVDGGETWERTFIPPSTSSNTIINIPTITAGDDVFIRGVGSRIGTPQASNIITATGLFNASGDIMSLLYGSFYEDEYTISGGVYTFKSLFANSTIVSAKDLIIKAPVATGCQAMFYNCTNLIYAPELPAETLTDSCYYQMFQKCTSLQSAPELPAKTLTYRCYREMFSGCSNLSYVKALATSFPARESLLAWLRGVKNVGVFVKDINATWGAGESGIPNNWTVENYTE